MGIYSNNIKPILQRKDILIRLIVINVCIFLILAIANIAKLFEINITDIILNYIAVPAQLDILLARLWTPLTYMFVHENFLHILFNMLMLYWFGQIFLSYFNPKNLGSLYILGGLAGALLYVLSFNAIPLLIKMNYVHDWGFSFGYGNHFRRRFLSTESGNYIIHFRQGENYLYSLILFVLDFIGLGSLSNPGGHIAI